MTHFQIHKLMIAGIILVCTSYIALAASEVISVAPAVPPPDIWSSLADKVPGLLTLVFLVVVFFRHLDKKNESHRDTIASMVTAHSEDNKRQSETLREVAIVLEKVKDTVERLEKKHD